MEITANSCVAEGNILKRIEFVFRHYNCLYFPEICGNMRVNQGVASERATPFPPNSKGPRSGSRAFAGTVFPLFSPGRKRTFFVYTKPPVSRWTWSERCSRPSKGAGRWSTHSLPNSCRLIGGGTESLLLATGQALTRVGGPDRVRTDDLFHAMEARSQLRHRPIVLFYVMRIPHQPYQDAEQSVLEKDAAIWKGCY